MAQPAGFLASCSEDGSLVIHDADAKSVSHVLTIPAVPHRLTVMPAAALVGCEYIVHHPFTHLLMRMSYKQVAVGSSDGSIYVMHARIGSRIAALPG